MAYISDECYDSYYPDNQIRYEYKHKIIGNKKLHSKYKSMSDKEMEQVIERNKEYRLKNKQVGPAIKSKFRKSSTEEKQPFYEESSTDDSDFGYTSPIERKVVTRSSSKLGKRSREETFCGVLDEAVEEEPEEPGLNLLCKSALNYMEPMLVNLDSVPLKKRFVCK
jgi:hypothetical protein